MFLTSCLAAFLGKKLFVFSQLYRVPKFFHSLKVCIFFFFKPADLFYAVRNYMEENETIMQSLWKILYCIDEQPADENACL